MQYAIKINGYVYVVKCQEYYKIGRTGLDVNNRIKQLQVSNPHELQLVLHGGTDNPSDLELSLHEYFKDKHHRGEWYKLGDEDLVTLEDIINAYNDYGYAKNV